MGQARDLDRDRAAGSRPAAQRAVAQLTPSVVAPGPDGTAGRRGQAMESPGCDLHHAAAKPADPAVLQTVSGGPPAQLAVLVVSPAHRGMLTHDRPGDPGQ